MCNGNVYLFLNGNILYGNESHENRTCLFNKRVVTCKLIPVPLDSYLAELEYVSISKRSLVGNLSLAISLTIGCSYQPWLLMYLGDWKIWHHILYAQTIVVVAAPW